MTTDKQSTGKEVNARKPRPGYSARILVLLFLAAGLAAWLLYHHVGVHAGYITQSPLCDISSTWSCTSVAQSKYSEFLSIPVASWGLVYYIAFIVLLLLFAPKDSGDETSRLFADVVFFAALLLLPPTIFLASVSLFVVKALCMFCSGLYLINLIIFILAYLHPERSLGLSASIGSGIQQFFRLLFGSKNSALLRGGRGGKLLAFWAMLGLGLFLVVETPEALISGYFEPKRLAMSSEDRLTPIVEQWAANPKLDIPVSLSDSPLDKDFIYGSPDATLTLVEFSDFQCPWCRKASYELKPLVDAFPGKVRLVFKNYPIDASCNPAISQGSGHQFACKAARMARCAGFQGDDNFWVMHDLLFQVDSWSEEVLSELPYEANLDVEAFEECLELHEVRKRVEQDIKAAYDVKIQGTPSFFVNGRKLEILALEILPDVIDLILKNQKIGEE